jgi:hypothetical protein
VFKDAVDISLSVGYTVYAPVTGSDAGGNANLDGPAPGVSTGIEITLALGVILPSVNTGESGVIARALPAALSDNLAAASATELPIVISGVDVTLDTSSGIGGIPLAASIEEYK